jgi:hypothetical protein
MPTFAVLAERRVVAEKVQDARTLGHGIGDPKGHQVPAVSSLEQQIAEHARAVGLQYTHTAQQQTRASRDTARSNRSTLLARLAALIAPADVPQIILNGLRERAGSMLAMARNTPTWYAARAPPPLIIKPTV